MLNGVVNRRARLVWATVCLSALALFGRSVAVGAEPPRSAPPTVPIIADLDRDGRQDALIIKSANPRIVSVDLSASHQTVDLVNSADVVASATEDWDHDGDIDVVTLSANGRLMFWLNQGHGTFVLESNSLRRPPPSSPASFAVSPASIGDVVAATTRQFHLFLGAEISIAARVKSSIAPRAPALAVLRSAAAAPDRPRPPPSFLA